MSTIVIDVNHSEKAQALVEFLKSIDYITDIKLFDDHIKAKQLFDEINKVAADTDFSKMTMEDINKEIKAYRGGK